MKHIIQRIAKLAKHRKHPKYSMKHGGSAPQKLNLGSGISRSIINEAKKVVRPLKFLR